MMNCDTIDSILDERRSALLPDTQRQGVAAHLARCRRCADSWAAHEAVAGESMGEPPAGLWERVEQGGAATLEVRDLRDVRAAAGRRAWLKASGLAAAAAVAFLAVRALVTAPTGEPSSGEAEPVAAAAPVFVEGRHYFALAKPAFDAGTGDRIAVQEFFMYLCFPCYSFEDELASMEAEGNIALELVPAMFHPEAQLHARAFYTAEALGKLDEMHAAFYDEIHERGDRLASRTALEEFFARFGVDAAAFDAAFDSREVDARVRRAAALGAELDVTATPTLVVAGRYRTSPNLAGADTLAVVEQLVAAEAQRRSRLGSAVR